MFMFSTPPLAIRLELTGYLSLLHFCWPKSIGQKCGVIC